MARSFTFETLNRRQIARLRRDAQEPYTLLGYEDTESRPLGLAGDDVGPYVHAIGRASTNGGAAAPTSIPAVDDGEAQRLLTDEYGRLWVRLDASSSEAQAVLTTPNPIADATTNVYSVTPATVGSAAGALVIKASAGRLRRVLIVNNDVATRYAMVFDAAAVGDIATGTMRTPGMPIPAGGFGFFDFSEADLACPTGIAVALSTTQTTYTAVAVTGQFSAQYA